MTKTTDSAIELITDEKSEVTNSENNSENEVANNFTDKNVNDITSIIVNNDTDSDKNNTLNNVKNNNANNTVNSVKNNAKNNNKNNAINNVTKNVKNKFQNSGFIKYNWIKRIAYGSGDLIQGFIYQTISSYFLFFYTNVYILGGEQTKAASKTGKMMLVESIFGLIWCLIVGVYVDKHHPRWGKYRSYLIYGGIPLTITTLLCFCDFFNHSIIYAVVTYCALQMCFISVNIPYSALNASLTRDTNEIVILTSTRLFMANVGNLCACSGIPLVVALFAGSHLPLKYCFFQMLGCLPYFIFIPLIPIIKSKIEKLNVFYFFTILAMIGYGMTFVFSKFNIIVGIYFAQFIKSSGLAVTTGYLWALIPEVISYSEYTINRRISGIINAIVNVFLKVAVALGTAIPGWVFAYTDYNVTLTENRPLSNNLRAWFLTITVFVIIGLILLIFCFFLTKEKVIMNEGNIENVKKNDPWKEFIRNRPLRILCYSLVIIYTSNFIYNSSTAFLMNDLNTPDGVQKGVYLCVSAIPSGLLLFSMYVISYYTISDEEIEEMNRKVDSLTYQNLYQMV